jgi:hypothetical protein
MQHALFRLGFHDCYHMHTIREHVERDAPSWTRALEAKYAGKGTFDRKDWDKLLGHCQAVCDVPAAFFGPELAAAYPEAKVVILNRDPEKWYESVLHSIHGKRSLSAKLAMIFGMTFVPAGRAWLKFGMAMRRLGFGFDHRSEKEKALAWYKGIYEEYRENIPEERRIEFTVSDGWKPLCEHLGVPVPQVKDEKTGKLVDAPFPWVNDRAMFLEDMAMIRKSGVKRGLDNIYWFVGKTTVTAAAGYALYVLWKSQNFVASMN